MDDAAMVRLLVRQMLETLGFVVVDEADPAIAIAIALDAIPAFDLVVSDVVMPGMTGGEMVQRIHEAQPGLPVVFMSAYAPEKAYFEHGLPPSAPYLKKPFTREGMAEKVNLALGR